jgi:hypothetical protein
MRKNILCLLAILAVVIFSCQKELSLEQPGTPAEGSLQADVSGDCLPKTVNGVYSVGTALVSTTNTITVDVNVTRTGTYTITTDTVNGYYFRGVGIFTNTGNNTVTLRGNGTPFANGINNFVVSFDGTVCDVQVTVASLAAYSLVGSPTCTAPTSAGTYGLNMPLTTANTVTLNVNVITIGAYTIATSFQGMTFSKTGLFTATGAQTVVLDGTGIPVTAGANVVPITVGTSTCSFTINVLGPGQGTLGATAGACTPATVNGVYSSGIILNPATNTVDIQVNVTTPGTFNITTGAAVAGFSFAFSGILTTTGVQTVTLQGTGTPTATGPQTFTVTLGAGTCTFSVTVAGPAVYTINCGTAVANGTYQALIPLTAANTITIPITVTSAGSYSITTTQVNGMIFSGSGTLTLATTSITLNGTGTPAAAVPTTIPVGTPVCNVSITVLAAPAIDWKFNIGTTVYQGQTFAVDFDNTSLPPFTGVIYEGDNAASDYFNIDLIDIAGGILATETYNTNTPFTPPIPPTANLGYFYFDGSGLELEASDPATTPGVNIVITVDSHNTTTRTIIGRFSGTALDLISNTVRTITLGTFTAVYP